MNELARKEKHPVPIVTTPSKHKIQTKYDEEINFFINEIGETQEGLVQQALDEINLDPALYI